MSGQPIRDSFGEWRWNLRVTSHLHNLDTTSWKETRSGEDFVVVIILDFPLKQNDVGNVTWEFNFRVFVPKGNSGLLQVIPDSIQMPGLDLELSQEFQLNEYWGVTWWKGCTGRRCFPIFIPIPTNYNSRLINDLHNKNNKNFVPLHIRDWRDKKGSTKEVMALLMTSIEM